MDIRKTVIRGDIVWTDRDGSFIERKDSYLVIDDGLIEGVYDRKPQGEYEYEDHRGSLVIPGLCDLHMHAPQYQYAGLFMDEELLQWLENHTFPEEAKYRNMDYAEKAYSIFVGDLRKSATTRASIFATIHRDATIMLMDKLEKSGMKGFVGKVNMDRNSPDYLIEDTDESFDETVRFIDEASQFENIKPIITPRFIPSCSEKLLEKLGRLVTERNLPVQSHLNENLSEVQWVKELCPWSENYAQAYDRFSMLGQTRTIMAHVVWPTDKEIALLKKNNVFIAHCPSSNNNLSSGIAPVRRYLEAGINMGLATDVAGGSALTMFRIMTEAILSSKIHWRLRDSNDRPLKFSEAFWLATRKGGEFFGKVGAFEKGYEADVVVLDTEGNLHTTLYDELTPSQRLELYSYRYPGQFIKSKYVAGKKLF